MPGLLVTLTVHCMNLTKAEWTLHEKVLKLYTREPTLHKPHHGYIHAIEKCVVFVVKPTNQYFHGYMVAWVYSNQCKFKHREPLLRVIFIKLWKAVREHRHQYGRFKEQTWCNLSVSLKLHLKKKKWRDWLQTQKMWQMLPSGTTIPITDIFHLWPWVPKHNSWYHLSYSCHFIQSLLMTECSNLIPENPQVTDLSTFIPSISSLLEQPTLKSLSLC